MTSRKSSPVAVRTRPRYLKDLTISSGCPYVLKAVAAPTHAYSSTSRHIFRYAPQSQISVVEWWRLSAFQGTNMSQAEQWGWG